MRGYHFVTAVFCLMTSTAIAQTIVTSITMPVGSSVHVTMYDVYSDSSIKPVAATNSDWTSVGSIQIGNIDVDATGWTFSGTAPGVATAKGIDTANNVTGPPLTVTVTPAGSAPPTVTNLQYTSP